MALWDSADLLARCKADAQRPATDEDMSDAQWYSFLTEAQDQVVRDIATLWPNVLANTPTLLTSADNGLTYTFSTAPLVVVELTESKGGRALRLGPYGDPTVEFTWEGPLTIRAARASARTFTAGPYSRWVVQPGVIDGSTQPTLPAQFCPLLPPLACYRYAKRGGYRDPAPYLDHYQRLWSGDPAISGDFGILGALRQRQATNALSTDRAPWWRATGDIG